MRRIIKSMENKYYAPALDFVEKVFTEYKNLEEGALEKMGGIIDYSFYESLCGE